MINENTGKAVSKNVGANEHLEKCVKVCLTNIWIMKRQNDMETQACKYGFLNSSSIHEE